MTAIWLADDLPDPPTRPGGPVQERAEVIDNRPVGGYARLLLSAPRAAGRALPGQFAALAVGDDPTATLLRRAFSLHHAGADGPHGPTLQIVVAAHGPGSRWVAERRPGDLVDVRSPLGRPFPWPPPGAPVVLVGGGYGSAPLTWWAAALRAGGHPVAAVIGAAGADRLFGVPELSELADRVLVTTDDGSVGAAGRVTDVLGSLLGAGTQVYACGPMAMLRAVTAVAAAHAARAWCTVEESMACGIGICMTCVLPVRDGEGVTRMTRTCVEGPTFEGSQVRWDAVRPDGGADVPADCLGAPVSGAGRA